MVGGHGKIALKLHPLLVAAVIAAAIDNDATIGRQWELVNGSVPIVQAIAEATAPR